MRVVNRTEWHPDGNNCEVCDVNFTFFRRRHHCRFCAKCVCHDCSKHTFVSQRVCVQCINKCCENASLKEKFTTYENKAKARLSALHDDIVLLRDAEKKLLEELNFAQNTVFELRAQIDENDNEELLASLKKELNQWKMNYNNAMKQMEKLKSNVEEKAKSFVNTSQQLADAKQKIKELKDLKEELHRQQAKRVEQLTIDNIDKNKENIRLKGLLEASKATIKELRNQLQEAQTQLDNNAENIPSSTTGGFNEQFVPPSTISKLNQKRRSSIDSNRKSLQNISINSHENSLENSLQYTPSKSNNAAQNGRRLSLQSNQSPATNRALYSALAAFRRPSQPTPTRTNKKICLWPCKHK